MLVLLLTASLSLPPGPDAVPPADPEVRDAINLYDELEFGPVVPMLKRALGRAELGEADRRAALAYLARAYAVLRKPRRAIDVFARLLELEPSFAVAASESPLIQKAIQAARERLGGGIDETSEAVVAVPPAAPTSVPPPQIDEYSWGATEITLVATAGAAVVATVIVLVLAPWKSDPPRPGNLGLWWSP